MLDYFVHFARGNENLMNDGTNQIKVNLIHRIRKEKRKPDMLSRDLQQLCAQTLARLYRDSRKPRVFFIAQRFAVQKRREGLQRFSDLDLQGGERIVLQCNDRKTRGSRTLRVFDQGDALSTFRLVTSGCDSVPKKVD